MDRVSDGGCSSNLELCAADERSTVDPDESTEGQRVKLGAEDDDRHAPRQGLGPET